MSAASCRRADLGLDYAQAKYRRTVAMQSEQSFASKLPIRVFWRTGPS